MPDGDHTELQATSLDDEKKKSRLKIYSIQDEYTFVLISQMLEINNTLIIIMIILHLINYTHFAEYDLNRYLTLHTARRLIFLVPNRKRIIPKSTSG